MAHPQDLPLHRVHVKHPITSFTTGPTTSTDVGAPAPGSFDPAAVRVVPAAEIRPGDVLVGTCQPRYDRRTLEPLTDRAQFVWYFAGAPTPQREGARPFDAAHCDDCLASEFYLCIDPDAGYTVLDGCTVYPPEALVLAVPRELADTAPPTDEPAPAGEPSASRCARLAAVCTLDARYNAWDFAAGPAEASDLRAAGIEPVDATTLKPWSQ
ncbi:hypothetical protein ACGRHY_29160 [Streptomyces sp. HK10]|uniref:hypothetical protein n=1 Tax=Streptomyces sp. HK10 TaxID=3373255 RepID=UPI0037493798